MSDDTLIQTQRAVLIRGLVAIAFALIAWARPGLTVAILLILFAAFVIEDGVMALVGSVRAARREAHAWPLALEGISSIALGLLTLFLPARMMGIAIIVIAIWALATGALELLGALGVRRHLGGEALMALSGVVRVVFGVLLLLRPRASLYALVWLTAGYAFADGLILLALSLRLRQADKSARTGGIKPQPA